MLLIFSKIKSNNKIIKREEYLNLENQIIKKYTNKKLKHNLNGKPYIEINKKISITNNNKIVIILINDKNCGIDLQVINEKKLSKSKTIHLSINEALYKCTGYFTNKNKFLKNNIIKIENKIYFLGYKLINNYIISICYEI